MNTDFKLIPIEFINDGSLMSEPYHPGDPQQGNWQSGNKAAAHWQGIFSVWRNMATYINNALNSSDFNSKLQLKAALCELKILIDIVPVLHSIIMKTPIYEEDSIRPYISLNLEEKKDAGDKYKAYNLEKEEVISKLNSLRNNIGSHFAEPELRAEELNKTNKIRAGVRIKLSWTEIESLWQKIDILEFRDVILKLHDYLDYIRTLPIYEWYREDNGRIRTHVPFVGQKNPDGTINCCIASSELIETLKSKNIDLSRLYNR